MTALLVLAGLVAVAVAAIAAGVIGFNARAIRREDQADILTGVAPDRAALRARRLNGLHVRGTHGAAWLQARDASRTARVVETGRVRREDVLV